MAAWCARYVQVTPVLVDYIGRFQLHADQLSDGLGPGAILLRPTWNVRTDRRVRDHLLSQPPEEVRPRGGDEPTHQLQARLRFGGSDRVPAASGRMKDVPGLQTAGRYLRGTDVLGAYARSLPGPGEASER
ncbi:hypothetical protein GCM10009602_18430 [Nocardiopsis tropica]